MTDPIKLACQILGLNMKHSKNLYKIRNFRDKLREKIKFSPHYDLMDMALIWAEAQLTLAEAGYALDTSDIETMIKARQVIKRELNRASQDPQTQSIETPPPEATTEIESPTGEETQAAMDPDVHQQASEAPPATQAPPTEPAMIQPPPPADDNSANNTSLVPMDPPASTSKPVKRISHGEPGFRQDVKRFTHHYWRKDGLTFRTEWVGFKLVTMEKPDSALKATKAMESYLNSISTRARNTIIARKPELFSSFVRE